MQRRRHAKKLTLKLALLAALAPITVLAAGTATMETDDDTMTFYWQDNDYIRLDHTDSDYMVIRDDKAYMVMDNNGQPQVMDLSAVAGMFSALADTMKEDSDMPEHISNFTATGKTETIAGIKGEVYEVTITKKNGESETREVVLTDNVTAQELTQVYVSAIHAMTRFDELEDMLAELPKNKRGVLRVDDEYRLTSISDKTPSDKLFELPGKPMNLQDMLKDLQGMAK